MDPFENYPKKKLLVSLTWLITFTHHLVFNPNKPDKSRVVYDAGAQYQNTPLNQNFIKEPDFLNNLVNVLMGDSGEKSPWKFFKWFWDFVKKEKVFLPNLLLKSFLKSIILNNSYRINCVKYPWFWFWLVFVPYAAWAVFCGLDKTLDVRLSP